MTPTRQIDAGDPGHAPVGMLRECPFNPRRDYDETGLRELAASMTAGGCLQPLLVRPMPATAKRKKDGEWVGLDHFGIVAGHRRFRAAKLARFDTLPVLVRHLTDDQVRAAMLVENAQREDLKPSEEAKSLAELVAKHGLEWTAEKVGRQESVVRERSALAKLPGWFLAAVDAGLVPVGTAAVVARVPGEESREKAAVCVADGMHAPHSLRDDWRGEWFDASGEEGEEIPALRSDYEHVLTFRDAKELIRTHFCRELKGAPFSRKALYVLPDCEPGHERSLPTCDDCPKRAGNDPELKAEGVRADTCTDPDCYGKKAEAYRQQECERFGRKWGIPGLEAIGDPWRGEQPPKGYLDIDARANGSELGDGFQGDPTVLELVGRCGGAVSNPVPKLLSFDGKGKPRALVRTAELKRRLIRAGVMRRPDVEKRVPLGDEEVSLRPAKAEAGGLVLYRVTNPKAEETEFEVPADATQEEIAAAAFDAIADVLSYGWEPVPSEPA